MSALIEILHVLFRWLHIASAAVVVGFAVYARVAIVPALASAPLDTRLAAQREAGRRFRPLLWAALVALILSGLYSYVSAPGHTPRYHMALGVKLLLAAHVLTVGFVVTAPPSEAREQRRARLLTGMAVSGLVVILLGAYLRRIF